MWIILSKKFFPFALITHVSISSTSFNSDHPKKKQVQEHSNPKVWGKIDLQLLKVNMKGAYGNVLQKQVRQFCNCLAKSLHHNPVLMEKYHIHLVVHKGDHKSMYGWHHFLLSCGSTQRRSGSRTCTWWCPSWLGLAVEACRHRGRHHRGCVYAAFRAWYQS